MPVDPRFHGQAGPQRLGAIAAAAGLAPPSDPDRLFQGVAPLQTAGPGEVSFLDNRRYLAALATTRAGAVVVNAGLAARVPPGTLALVSRQPALGFARIALLFHPAPPPRPGIHPSAVVAEDAVLGPGCEVGPLAVIGARAELGPGCRIGPHAVVGEGVVLGPGCRLLAHASISHAVCGAGVVLHPGARVGQEGFGFTLTPEGRYETIPQLGRVILGDAVEIGANACVDRGSQQDTVLGPGTRLDNLVQIAHNVAVGRGGILVAQSGLAGSVTLGDFVQVAAQVGVVGHLTVGDRARIGGQAGVTKDVPAGADVMGTPAEPVRQHWRTHAWLRRQARSGGNAPAGDGAD